MMIRDHRDYVLDIANSIKEVESFVGNMSFKKFISDKKTVNAVIRSIEVIGEATKKLPSSLKDKYPNIPWKNMAGMRDKLIHEYFGVDIEILWMVIKKDLPSIKDDIREIATDIGK